MQQSNLGSLIYHHGLGAYAPSTSATLARLGGWAPTLSSWASQQPGGMGEYGDLGGLDGVIGPLFWLSLGACNAYHGYKRNGDSVPWAFIWFLFSFGPIGLIVSMVQGWAEPSDSVKLKRLTS